MLLSAFRISGVHLTHLLHDLPMHHRYKRVQSWRQEAQLPLRNRASAKAMHFFVAKLLSFAVMTYSYVYHLRNLRPANFLCSQRINFSMWPQHVCMTRDLTVVWCLLSREPMRVPAKTLYCQKPELHEQHESCYSIGLSVFRFTQLSSIS